MLAQPIVHGFEKETAGKVDVVHLNLLSAAGREVSGRYGVRIVPATLLFNHQGELIQRVSGVPKLDELLAHVAAGEREEEGR